MADGLAIHGGTPVRTLAFPPWPYLEPDEIDGVISVLRSGKINYHTGEEGRCFEKEFAEFTNTRYAVALANGSVALELLLHTYGIGPGDDVIVTPRSFIASVSSVVLCGGRPIFADVDRESQNITAETIEKVLTPNTRAIIAVHLAGWTCDMDLIMKLAEKKNIVVIEDCAQAHGAQYKGQPVGSLGHAAAFSFCQDKILTTGGEGGMITTNDEAVWKKAWSYKDHGKDYDTLYQKNHPPGFRWLHSSFGTNWRLTEMQSAMGRILLRKLQYYVQKRRENASQISKCLQEFSSCRLTIPSKDVYHSYYKYYVFLRPEQLRNGWTRDKIMQAINAEGVPCQVGSCSEIYLEEAFPAELQPRERLPIARELGETALMFLVHPTLTEHDVNDICTAIRKVLSEATAA